MAAEPATQVVMLTQSPTFYSVGESDTGSPYTKRSSVLIPDNLPPQNKWIMFEGPVLENDKVAYRFYADTRHRFDIYGKRVPDLVMDTVSWKYHDIMNWGADILKVGNSLGMGSPGIWYQDSIYTLSASEEKVIEVSELPKGWSGVRVKFKKLRVGEHTFDLEQDWTIGPGNYWTEIALTVQNGQLPEGMHFATGIVKHLPEVVAGQAGNYVYAMNWGKQSFHKEDLGMAVLAEQKYQPEMVGDELSHLMVFRNAPKTVEYRFLAVWERDQSKTKTADDFRKQVVTAAGQPNWRTNSGK